MGYVIPEEKTKEGGGALLGLSNTEQSGTWQSIGAFSGNDTQYEKRKEARREEKIGRRRWREGRNL